MNAHTGERWLLWLVTPLLMVLGACRDNGVGPFQELPQSIITIVDTSFTITATRQPATGSVTLSVQGTIRFAANTSPLQILSYTLQYPFTATEVIFDFATRSNQKVQLLQVRDSIQNFFPLHLRPLKEVRVKFLAKNQGRDTVVTVVVPVQAHCALQGNFEPGLLKLYEGPDMTLGQMVWSHDGGSLYFDVRRDANEEVCRYRFEDGMTAELTPRDKSLAVCDESPDGKLLLLRQNDGAPSNLYLMDLQTLNLKVLLPPHDSSFIGSAKFSPDGRKVAFLTEKIAHESQQRILWLFDRNDSTLKKLNPDYLTLAPTLADWNADNELVYSDHNVDLYVLSTVSLTTRRISYPYAFYPGQLLTDHSTVVGTILGDLNSNYIVEQHLAFMDPSGKPLRQLSFAGGAIFEFAVSPNRSKVAFVINRDGGKYLELYLLPTR